MNPGTRRTWLALFAVVVWLLAAVSARRLGIWNALGGAAVALGIVLLLLDRRTARALLRPRGPLVLLGGAAGGVMTAATYLIYPRLVRSVPLIVPDAARLYEAFRVPSLIVAAIALVPVIVGEELVWRGAVQGALAERVGTRPAVAVAAVTYALVHAPLGSPVLVAVALGCGLAWGILRATTASLVPAVVAHLLWNVLVLLWWPLDAR